jgi:hypothetical protein
MAFHLLQRGDAAVGQRVHDRVVAERAVDLHRGIERLHRVGVLQVDARIARGTQAREFQLTGQEALHHARVVGGGEQLHRNAEAFFEIGLLAGMLAQAVGFVLAAQKADPEHRNVFAPVLSDRLRWRSAPSHPWRSRQRSV